MKAVIKERIYLLIIIFCVVMCGAMIVTMISGGAAEKGVEHIPVIREIKSDEQADNGENETNNESSKQNNAEDSKESVKNGEEDTSNAKTPTEHHGINETSGQIAITEDFVNEQLGRFLPPAFPVKSTVVDIGADGIVTLSGMVNRDKLKGYLKDLGVDLGLKYSVALLMLPKEFDAEVELIVKESGDKLTVDLYSAELDAKNIPVSLFPGKVADVLSDAVNKMISSVDEVFEFYGFEDGAILFQKA